MEHNQLQPYLKNSPISILSENEFQIFLMKFGSLMMILNNKTINPTFLFLSIIKNDNYQIIFKKMSGIPTLFEILRILLITYPNLVKSKIVKDNSIKLLKLKDTNGNKRKSKKHL
jgi:hypothetical protein